MIGNLYIIVNKINGKCYIGKTYKDIQERFKEHIRESKKERCKNRPLYRAFNKYGIENFYIMSIGLFKDGLLEEKEVEYIKFLGTYKDGYNATLGGDSKRYLTFTEQEIIDEYNKCKNANFISKKFSCDLKTVLNILHSNNIHIQNSICEIMTEKYGTSITQFDLESNEINNFPSLKNAEKWLIDNDITNSEYAHTKILLCCQGKRKTAYGYVWKYKKDEKCTSFKNIEK